MNYIEPNPPIEGWMSTDELQWLYGKACGMETIAEIGSWMGRSTHALLSGCKGTVHAIDHFKGSPSEINFAHGRAKTEDIHAIFMKNVGHFPNLLVFKMDSIEASGLFDTRFFDMVFIDGDHAYPQVRQDIEAWMPKCRKLFCGHDMNQGGAPKAFEELNLKPKSEIGSIWSLEL